MKSQSSDPVEKNTKLLIKHEEIWVSEMAQRARTHNLHDPGLGSCSPNTTRSVPLLVVAKTQIN